jgi:phosphoglucomutase/phosphomannomutase
VVLRPSGTEPKAKIYIEVCSPPCGTAKPDAWRRSCVDVEDLAKRLSAEFVKQALAKIGLDPSAAGMK